MEAITPHLKAEADKNGMTVKSDWIGLLLILIFCIGVISGVIAIHLENRYLQKVVFENYKDKVDLKFESVLTKLDHIRDLINEKNISNPYFRSDTPILNKEQAQFELVKKERKEDESNIKKSIQ